jgi:hypothetical protein
VISLAEGQARSTIERMPALSPLFISILEGCLRAGATHATITPSQVQLMRDDAEIGTGDLPSGAYAVVAGELRGMGARDGAQSKVTVHSPVGPLEMSVEIAGDTTVLRFPRDADQAAGEAAFSALVGQAQGLGASGVRCVPQQVAFMRGQEMLAVAALDDATRETLIAYGRTVASIGPGERTGKAVLMSESGQPRMLDVELFDGGVSFSFG